MFQGRIIPGVEFVLDLQGRYLKIRDIVRVCHVTADGHHVMVQPIGSNLLIRLPVADFRVYAKPRVLYTPVDQDQYADT